jgi:hypothetical protein
MIFSDDGLVINEEEGHGEWMDDFGIGASENPKTLFYRYFHQTDFTFIIAVV